MIATSAPFSQYFDKNGDPLDSGFVFFGVPDANPETSPIPAYWDEAGTQPVAQPARTLAGYIVRNGTPARVYTEGAYSQTVKNKRGEPVYYAANSEDYSNLPVNVATIEATAGQTNVTLPFSYTRGNNSLAVYLNGSLLLKDRDYIETSDTSFQMLYPLKVGPGGADEVTAIGGRLINPSSAIGTVSAAALAAGSGAGLVGFDPALPFPADTVGEWLQIAINGPVNVLQYGPQGAGATIQAAIDANPGRQIYIPEGTWTTAVPIVVNAAATQLVGDGSGAGTGSLGTNIVNTGAGDAIRFEWDGVTSTTLHGCGISKIGVTRYSHVATGAAVHVKNASNFRLDDCALTEHFRCFYAEMMQSSFVSRLTAYTGNAFTGATDSTLIFVGPLESFVPGDPPVEAGWINTFTELALTSAAVSDFCVFIRSGDSTKFTGGYMGDAKLALVAIQNFQDASNFATAFTNFYFDGVRELTGTPKGIWVRNDSSTGSNIADLQLNGCTFGQLENAVRGEDPNLRQLSITGGQMFNLAGHAISITSAALELNIAGLTISRSGTTNVGEGGLSIGGARSVTVSGTAFDNMTGTGQKAILLQGTIGAFTLTGSSFLDCQTDLDDATATIANYTLSGNTTNNADKKVERRPTVVVDAITVVNASVLRLRTGDVVVARGRSAAGDGGAIPGGYRYDAASGAAVNGGTVIAPTAGGGRLIALTGGDPLNLAWFVTGEANPTAQVAAWLAAGGGFVPDGIYTIDDITVSNRVRVIGSPDAIFKRRTTGSANSTMILFAAGSEDSVWDGPTVDGARDGAVKAAFSAANPSYPGYWSGWFGVQSQAARITYRGKFTNHVSKPCWFAGDDNVVDIVCEDHGDAAVFGYQWFDSVSVNRIDPRPSGNGAMRQTVRCISIRADNDGVQQVIPHAIDVMKPKNGNYALECYDMDGSTPALSTYVSGITIEVAEGCTFARLVANNFLSDALIHLGVSILGNIGSPVQIAMVRGIAGQALEMNGCFDSPVSSVDLDGQFRATTACPLGSALNVGVSAAQGVWNEYRNAKSSAVCVRSDILGGTVQRFRRGAATRVGEIGFDSVNFIGNLLDGVLYQKSAFVESFTGAPADRQRVARLTNCNVQFNGRAGVYADSFENIDISGSYLCNNGQDTTQAASTRGGLFADNGARLAVRSSAMNDTQTWTDVDACTFEPQSSVSDFLTVYLQDIGRVSVGQFVRLVNGTGVGDVVAKVWAVGVNDSVTLQTSGAVTLSETGNTTALTGTWSGSGTTLTGTGTAATTEIIGATYVTDGTNWRRVVKATSATSIIIDSAFPSALSGATLSKLLVDVSGIPSQQQGAWIASGVSAYMLGADNSYDGNVSFRTVVSDVSEAVTGCVYYRKQTVNAASTFNLQNLQTGIPLGHRLTSVAVNVDTAISGGSTTSWSLALTNAGGTVLETIASGLALTKNTKWTSNCVGANSSAAGNLLRALYAGAPGIPTAGAFTSEARYFVEAIPALPDAP